MEMQSKFARNMMAQKLMSENKDNPFNSRFFQPSDAYSQQRTRPIQGNMTLGNLASYFMPFSKDIGPYEDSPRLDRPGGVNIDFPPIVKDAVSGINKFGQVFRGELSQDEIKQLAFDTSLNVTGGSLVGSKLLKNAVPNNALSMGLTTKATKSLDNAGEVAKVVPPTDKADGIFAFHGSGADFNEFSLSKINTGEGAQAFGYGLYFTDSKDIANFYKNAISQNKRSSITYKNKEVINRSDVDSDATLQDEVVSNIADQMYNFNKTASTAIDDRVQYIVKDLKELKSKQPIDEVSQLIVESLNRELTVLKNLDAKNFTKGKTYEVKINAVMDDLINYDIPLGQQSDNIKNILNKMKSEVNLDDARNFGVDPDDYGSNLFNYISRSSSRKDIEQEAIKLTQKMLFGKDQDVVRFLNDWAAIRGEQATGEKLLAKYGAKGIKYKADQGVGARNVPETGKNNYVIFDDKIIDIMAKYGIVGAIGVSAMQRGSGASEGDILPPGNT